MEYPVFSQVFSPGGERLLVVPADLDLHRYRGGPALRQVPRLPGAEGIKGGATYGFFLGLVAFFGQFYNPLIFEGFPYFLSWCWGGSNLIDGVIGGIVLGAIYRTA